MANTSQPRRQGDHPAVLLIAGVVLLASLVAAVVLSLAAFGGSFTRYVAVSVELPTSGNAVQPGDKVEYRDIAVGTVAGHVRMTGTHAVVDLHLEPAQARVIPADVRATVRPLSVFGNQYIDLVSPSGSAMTHVTRGQVIPADDSYASSSEQATFGDLYNILTAIHPAQLDAALSAVADALRGNGAAIGDMIDQVDGYLADLQPRLPVLVDDLRLLASVAGHVARDAPAILSSLDSLTTTARTVAAEQLPLGQALTQGAPLLDSANTLLAANASSIAVLATKVQPLLAAVADRPGVLPTIADGLSAWAKAWGGAIGPGPYLSFEILLPVPDPYSFLLAAEGGATGPGAAKQAFKTYLNPTPYTAADCTRYPGLAAPNCPEAAKAAATSSSGSRATTPDQLAAVQKLLSTLGLRPSPETTSIGQLLLAPLLVSAAGAP